jgi:hypothetical protein
VLCERVFDNKRIHGMDNFKILECNFEKLLRREMDFWTRAAGTSSLLKVTREVIREKKNGGNTIFERRENTLKWHGHVARMQDNRWS